jgi:hypothetical protein
MMRRQYDERYPVQHFRSFDEEAVHYADYRWEWQAFEYPPIPAFEKSFQFIRRLEGGRQVTKSCSRVFFAQRHNKPPLSIVRSLSLW